MVTVAIIGVLTLCTVCLFVLLAWVKLEAFDLFNEDGGPIAADLRGDVRDFPEWPEDFMAVENDADEGVEEERIAEPATA